MPLDKDALLQILERSQDWYIVVKVENEDIRLMYANQLVKENCVECAEYSVHPLLNSCTPFVSLVKVIKQVAQTRERVDIAGFLFKSKPNKILDLQIYSDNGHVIVCGRDVALTMSNLRANLIMMNAKLDTMLEGKIDAN